MAPGGQILVWETLQQGLSILNQQYATTVWIEATQRREKKEEGTKRNRMFDKAKIQGKRDPYQSVTAYDTMLNNVTTYEYLLCALFGMKNTHCEGVWLYKAF